jgi:hypothetical protein
VAAYRSLTHRTPPGLAVVWVFGWPGEKRFEMRRGERIPPRADEVPTSRDQVKRGALIAIAIVLGAGGVVLGGLMWWFIACWEWGAASSC